MENLTDSSRIISRFHAYYLSPSQTKFTLAFAGADLILQRTFTEIQLPTFSVSGKRYSSKYQSEKRRLLRTNVLAGFQLPLCSFSLFFFFFFWNRKPYRFLVVYAHLRNILHIRIGKCITNNKNIVCTTSKVCAWFLECWFSRPPQRAKIRALSLLTTFVLLIGCNTEKFLLSKSMLKTVSKREKWSTTAPLNTNFLIEMENFKRGHGRNKIGKSCLYAFLHIC